MTQNHDPKGIQLARILAGETHASVVYFLAVPYRHSEAVKIGTSTRLMSRISSVSYAATLADVLLLLPGGQEVETAWHREFREYRIEEFRELFRLKGRLKDFLSWSPPRVPLTVRLKQRMSRRLLVQPELKPAPQPKAERAFMPEPEPDPNEPISLLEIVGAFILPRATREEQLKYVQRLRQDRYRGDRGELPEGLEFPEPARVADDGRGTELFVPLQVIEFNAARRGSRAAR